MLRGSGSAVAAHTPRSAAGMIVDWLGGQSYVWSDERELQDAVADRLAHRFSALREKSLGGSERPDFLVTVAGFTVAVEIKVTPTRNPVWRQLGRYAAHEQVDAVVIASGRRTLLAGMPEAIHGKPVAVCLLAGVL